MAPGLPLSEEKEHVRWLTNAIGNLSLFASRHAKVTLLVVLAITAVFLNGATKLTTNVDVADVLPRGDYNTTAAHKLTDQFKSAFTEQVTLQFHVAGDGRTCNAKWQQDDTQKIPLRQTTRKCTNITDEVYIRAIAQAIAYMKAQDPYICCSIAVSDLFRLVNWTIAGGQNAAPAAYSLPDTSASGEREFANVDSAANQAAAIRNALDALSSPTWTTTAVLLTPPATLDLPMAEIGRRAIEARDSYIAWAKANPSVAYQVFTGENTPRLTVELPVANAHSSALTRADFGRLLPIIAGFILAGMLIAFRNIGATVIGFSSLAIGVLWTYGAEGYLGIALNPLNLTLMPLIMGVGVDYSIHIVNEFLEHRAAGLDNQGAFREVGRRAGLALFVGTSTTTIGLIVMVISPSILIAEFGLLAALSMATIFLLSLTFIPAALTLWPGTDRMGASFRPSPLVAAVARGVTRARLFALLIVILLSVVGTVAGTRIYNEAFGDPGRNYLPDDPVRVEHETGLKWFYEQPEPDVKANVIVFEGDLTNPAAHRYMDLLEAELKKTVDGRPVYDRIISDTLRTIPFLMRVWLTVKDGAPGAGLGIIQQGAGGVPYPNTRDAIRAEFDNLYRSPVQELGSIFTNGPAGKYQLGVMTFSVRAATYDEAAQVWNQVWAAIGNVSASKPPDIKVAMVGNTATNYLFVAKEVPYVYYMGAAATFGLMAIALAFFRSLRAVLCVGVVAYATTAWWFGLLPDLGIGMAITLVIPIVFIISLGSDYAVHLIHSIRKVGNVREVFRTTGKSILFSWITTIGPFIIFIGIQDLSVRKTMIATALAITIIFVVTMMTVPVFYRVEPKTPPAAPTPPPVPVPLVARKRPKPQPAHAEPGPD